MLSGSRGRLHRHQIHKSQHRDLVGLPQHRARKDLALGRTGSNGGVGIQETVGVPGMGGGSADRKADNARGRGRCTMNGLEVPCSGYMDEMR